MQPWHFNPSYRRKIPADIIFYEGLIRIPDERGRIIPARDFMPFVENIELGRKIDAVALELGLRHLLENPDIRISLNMSARSIGYGPWSDTLARYLRRDLNLGTRLILEITESSAILVPELVLSFMKDMRKRGITFALDDFGAGTTSFRYLRDFNFDVVKVDGQFIRGVAWRKLAIIRCWCRPWSRLRNISPCIRSQNRLKHRPMRIGYVRTVSIVCRGICLVSQK